MLDLELVRPSTRGYGAIDGEGRRVEIKCTTRRSIAFSGDGKEAERLVVIALDAVAKPRIVYDGPMTVALRLAGPRRVNGQRVVPISKLLHRFLDESAVEGRRPT